MGRNLAVDKVDGLVQNEGSFCTNVTGDVFLRKCYAFDYRKRPARPAEPIDTIADEGDSSPSYIPNEVTWVFQQSDTAPVLKWRAPCFSVVF